MNQLIKTFRAVKADFVPYTRLYALTGKRKNLNQTPFSEMFNLGFRWWSASNLN